MMRSADELTFWDLYTRDSVMAIFKKSSWSSIVGRERSRLRNLFGWTSYTILNRLAFLRIEVRAAAFLADQVDLGVMVEPAIESWPALVQEYADPVQFGEIIDTVTPDHKRYQRAVEQDLALDAVLPSWPPIARFMTVNQVAQALDCSRETVYRYSDLGDDRVKGVLRTVDYSGTHLWYPVPANMTLERVRAKALLRRKRL